MNLIERIKDFDFVPLVNRPETPLFRSLTSYSNYYFLYRVTGLKWKASFELSVNRDICFSRKELAELKQKIVDKYKINRSLFFQLAERVYRYCERLNQTAEKVEKSKDVDLLTLWNEYLSAALDAWSLLIIMPISDQVLSEEIKKLLLQKTKDNSKVKEYFAVLCLPEKENEPNKEEKAFLELCILAKNNDQSLDKKIKQHVAEFGWIGSRNLWDADWKDEDVIKRIDSFLASGIDPVIRLEKMQKEKDGIKAWRKEIEKELSIKPKDELSNLLEIAREYAFLRTYRTDSMHKAGFQVKPLLLAIAKRLGITYNDVIMMSFQEIKQSLERNDLVVPKVELFKRFREFGTVFIEGEFKIVSGLELERLKEIAREKLQIVKAASVKGNVAFKGKIIGRAKIVMSPFDLSKVQSGDILVTVMTFPNYIPAMEKAVAFVTDEGGILCHAAIVAREMHKPCIIGTKIATKVFKDGDQIEVDAVKGVVRKLLKGK